MATGIEEESQGSVPACELRAFPNPHGDHTQVSFSLERAGAVTCRVFDAAGNRVADLANGRMHAGQHSLIWDAGDAGPGTYFAELQTPAGTRCARLVKAR